MLTFTYARGARVFQFPELPQEPHTLSLGLYVLNGDTDLSASGVSGNGTGVGRRTARTGSLGLLRGLHNIRPGRFFALRV